MRPKSTLTEPEADRMAFSVALLSAAKLNQDSFKLDRAKFMRLAGIAFDMNTQDEVQA